ncbi:MAG: phosphoesterase [Bacteroidetes bacterium QS_1_63_11]|nr:MAG: phosphoesterase [Bacteroidetes bacterium QS_1_63_11]
MPNEPAYADLHTHTHCSDGTLAPDVLVQQAAERGVQVLAVTDHDTTAGLDSAREAESEHDIQLVDGVELSVEVEGQSVHLLGYGFDPTHEALTDYLAAFSQRRRERLDQMIQRLAETGIQVEAEQVQHHVGTSSAPGRPHLARALVDGGHVDSYRAAFEQYLGTDQPRYVPAPTHPAAEAIEVLHTAGGVAVLAHPGQWTSGETLRRLCEWGLDGIECQFPSHPEYLVDYYRTICRSRDLLATGGSDFHGGAGRDDETLGTVGLKKASWERFRDAAL